MPYLFVRPISASQCMLLLSVTRKGLHHTAAVAWNYTCSDEKTAKLPSKHLHTLLLKKLGPCPLMRSVPG